MRNSDTEQPLAEGEAKKVSEDASKRPPQDHRGPQEIEPSKADRKPGRQTTRSSFQRLVYKLLHSAARLAGVLMMGLRTQGREFTPAKGGVLVCSNHQSMLDPVLVGLACDRQLSFLARKTLFRIPGFGRFIKFMGAIPIDRDRAGIGGIKETLTRLKRGEMVLIFPEGTRTRDGEISPLKAGFCALARRGKTPILPVAIDGAFQAWPRSANLPRLSRIQIQFGPPIEPDLVAALSDEQLLREVERRLHSCFQQARTEV